MRVRSAITWRSGVPEHSDEVLVYTSNGFLFLASYSNGIWNDDHDERISDVIAYSEIGIPKELQDLSNAN